LKMVFKSLGYLRFNFKN